MAKRRKKLGLIKVLEKIAPGMELREGLDHIVGARTGALIVIGDTKNVMPLCNGGFELNCECTSQRLPELAKMDGAIILDKDMEEVIRVNVHLVPDPSLPTSETGMRHRTAERVSRQTNALVIAISQRRDVVSVYFDGFKYALEDLRVLLAKANQALSALEKYKMRLDQVSANLSALEFEDLVTVVDVVTVLQRSEMAERVAREIERYISELGVEGRLIDLQLEELMAGVEESALMVIKDYCPRVRQAERMRRSLAELSQEQLLDLLEISQLLGFEGDMNVLDQPVHPRGYRLLKKIPRLPTKVASNIVQTFRDLQTILRASIEQLDEVDGVGEIRARAIQEGLKRLKEYNILERYV